MERVCQICYGHQPEAKACVFTRVILILRLQEQMLRFTSMYERLQLRHSLPIDTDLKGFVTSQNSLICRSRQNSDFIGTILAE